MERICLECEKMFNATPSAVKVSGAKYCSYQCRNKSLWAQKEYREHMSKAHKGQIPTNLESLIASTRTPEGRKKISKTWFKKGHEPWCTGTKGIMISWSKGKKLPHLGGENHYRWISDRSLLKDDSKERGGQLHREWSKQVKNRDYWKCQISNDDCSGCVEAHHILGWRSHPELRYEVKNGITLCHFHHPRKRVEEERYVDQFQQLVAAKMQ